MRLLISILTAFSLSGIAHATEDALAVVPLPLDTLQGEIAVTEVPFIIGKALPESAFHAIGLPYLPPSVSFNEHEDINLASVAGIKVKPFHEDQRDYRIELDYDGVEELHHTDELLAAVVDCIYRVAGDGEEGYSIELVIINLDAGSPLHETLKRLIKERNTAAESASSPSP